MKETKNRRTELTDLSDKQAELIPVLLDMVYMGDLEDWVINSYNAMDLFELAKYFDVRQLEYKVECFVYNKASRDNIVPFLSQSENRPGYEIIFDMSVENLSKIYPTMSLEQWKAIKPSWLLKALTCHDSKETLDANAIISHTLFIHCSNIDKYEAESLLG